MLGLLSHSASHYSTQTLTRATRGRLDRWHLVLQHRLAARSFESQRRVFVRPLEKQFPGLSRIRATLQNAVQGPNWLSNADPYELTLLSAFCQYVKPQLIIEFGTFDGLTALHFAMNSPATASTVTIDLDPNDPLRQSTTDDTFYSQGVTVGEHFHGTPEAARIRQIYCNSMDFDHAPFARNADLIFIDAGHAYECVRSDSQKSLEMIAPGGIILWHDYHYAHEGVFRCLNELAGKIELFAIANTKFACHVSPPAAA